MAKRPPSKQTVHSVRDPLSLVTHRTQARFGWNRDLPDHQGSDLLRPAGAAGLPAAVDLRANCPPVYDQGQLGSCTANAIAGAIEFDRKKQTPDDFVPSRLFIYYNERVMEGTVSSDSGAQIRDGIKSVNKIGAPPETDWPYDIAKFAQKPPTKAYADAKLDRAIQYQRVVQTLAQLQGCLASGFRIRLRIHGLRELRIPNGRPDRNHAHACAGREETRRTCRHGRRL